MPLINLKVFIVKYCETLASGEAIIASKMVGTQKIDN